ncbi:MAG: effector-associated domain EAD1-containing protein [Caldilineaceae bacterium]
MKLSGPQYKQLRQALLDAFPTLDKLEQMVSFELEESLDSIAGGRDLRDRAFNLIVWAEARDQIPKLIEGACSANPTNLQLKAIKDLIIESPWPDSSEKGSHSKNKAIYAWIAIAVTGIISLVSLIYFEVLPFNAESCDPDKPCILISIDELTNDESISLLANVRREIDQAIDSDSYKLVPRNSIKREEAAKIAQEQGALLAIGGGFYEADAHGKIELWFVWNEEFEAINSSGIRPARVLPDQEISEIVPPTIKCRNCIDMSQGLGQNIQLAARTSAGLYKYLNGDYGDALKYFLTALQCGDEELISTNMEDYRHTCEERARLTEPQRQILLYYIGKTFALRGDYADGLCYLQAALVFLTMNSEKPDVCDIPSPSTIEFSQLDKNSTDPAILISMAQIYSTWLLESGNAAVFQILRTAEDAIDAQTNGGADAQLIKGLFNKGLIYELYSQVGDDCDKVEYLKKAYAEYSALSQYNNTRAFQYEVLIQLGHVAAEVGRLDKDVSYYKKAQDSFELAESKYPKKIWAYREIVLLNAQWANDMAESDEIAEVRQRTQTALQFLDNKFPKHMYTYLTKEAECRLRADMACSVAILDTLSKEFATSGWLLRYANEMYYYWAVDALPTDRAKYLESSVQNYKISSGLRQRDPWIHFQMGRFYMLMQNKDEAETYFEHAREFVHPYFIPREYSQYDGILAQIIGDRDNHLEPCTATSLGPATPASTFQNLLPM